MATRDQVYITIVRQYNRMIWEGVLGLKAQQYEFNSAVYGETLENGEAENEGILAADVGPVVFGAADALIAVIDSGVGGNMAKLL